MLRSDFSTSAEYHADCDRRAGILLRDQIARIDAALDRLERNRRWIKPFTARAYYDGLVSHRAKAEWYLSQPDNGGVTALGMMGANGRGPRLDDLIRSVDFHANQRRAA
ncbi:hypothetical protein [Sphingobium sp. CCH11-B1]|uniref:hypothetical protein n=1 Tax=Sphingobium sp. CCH11-B1 TaxID=1768781 RepID=UPI00083118D7|nr:hypothetical protein [Sphingobium sp. CCH11-B1]